MPNFSFLAGLEVVCKFVVVEVVVWMALSIVSNLIPSCIELELGLGFDDIIHLPTEVVISRF